MPCVFGEGEADSQRAHILQDVTELLAGVQVRVHDMLQPLIVVREQLSQFQVYKVCVGLVDDLPSREVEQRLHRVLRHDVVRGLFVPDGHTDFICAIFRPMML